MQTLVLVLHVIAAVAIVVLVLLQHGKGADVGAAFGSGSAGSLFGSAGAANFLSRSTAVLAAVFFATTLGLAYFSSPSKSFQPKISKAAAGRGENTTRPIPASRQSAVPRNFPLRRPNGFNSRLLFNEKP